MKSESKSTIKLLLLISDHLSGRKDCNSLSYVVDIHNNAVTMSPDIQVYPGVHDRKPEHRQSVVTHVMKYHLSQDILREVVPGRYVYQVSSDGKKRRWIHESMISENI